MSTSIIDGTVTETVPGRSRGGTTVLKSVTFQRDDGTSRTVTKAVVKDEIAAELKPGARGRFYLYEAFDLRGVHGVRTPDGREVHAFPGTNQKLFLLIGVINFAWIVFKLAVDAEIPLLGVALLILAVLGWYYMGKGAKEANAQFASDAGYAAPGAAPPAGALTQPLP